MSELLTEEPPIKKRSGRSKVVTIAVAFFVLFILVVVPIIVGISHWARGNARLQKCRVQIMLFENKLQDYEADYGNFPPGDGSDKSSRELFKAFYQHGILHDSKVYMPELDPKLSDQFENQIEGLKILDPFENGRPFFYLRSVDEDGNMIKDAHNPDFDLWSVGPDGKGRGDSGATTEDFADDVTNF
ncbi:MAG: hypothetical protein ACSHYB_17340 [Roseibacillus sp.]